MSKPRPRVKSESQKELDKISEQFEDFTKNVQELTLDRMSAVPKEEVEQQTKLSQNQISKSKDIYLKPSKSIGSNQKFNEKFRDEYNFQKEYVQFIAEHKELIGSDIETWTRPIGGMPAEFWNVPTNKPVWGPRYLAEQIKRKSYHRLIMQNTSVEHSGMGTMYGQLAADTTIARLDALPVSTRKSIFMGASGF